MTDAAIEAARLHWDLGDSPITPVAARENQVYYVDRPIGPAALRIHRPGYRSNAEINSELQWMAMLADHGFAVAMPIASTDGHFIQTCDGTAISLLSWIDGTPHSKMTVTPQLHFELGQLMAQMHNATDQWNPPPGFSRPTWDIVGDQPTWGRFWENPLLTKEQGQAFLTFRDDARQMLDSLHPLNFGLIHADLVPDNLLGDNKESGKMWVIDFDDGGFGHRILDIATVTFKSRLQFGSNEFADAVTAGYCEMRTLDKQALPLYEALRACTYVGWNISRINEAGGNERNARFIAQALDAIASLDRR